MHFYPARDQMTYALLSPVPPTLSSVSWTSFMSLPTDPPCRLHVCITCPDLRVCGSASRSFPPSQSPQPMETEVFLIVLFINIPAVNIYGFLSSHISLTHLPCRCYPGVIYILAQYRGLEVRTTCRAALVSPSCSFGMYGDVGRQDREYSAFFFQ